MHIHVSVFEIVEHVFQIEMSIFQTDICISLKMLKIFINRDICILYRDIGFMLNQRPMRHNAHLSEQL